MRFIQEKLKDLGELDRETLWCIGRRVYSGPNGSHLQRDAFRLEVVAAGCSKLHPLLRMSKTAGCLPTPKFLLLPPPRWWTWTHDCLDNSRWPLSSIWETLERPFLPHQATVRQGLEFWPASRLSLNWARLLHEWSWALPTKGKVVSLGWMLEIPWSSLARAVHS